MTEKLVKAFVRFDDPTKPPEERLWVKPRLDLGGDLFEVLNVPWFAEDFSFGDLVQVVGGEIVGVVERRNQTIRLAYGEPSWDKDRLRRAFEAARDFFRSRGIACEGARLGLLAVAFPISTSETDIESCIRGALAASRWRP